MERYSTEGVILKARDLGETDRVVELVTRDFGRLSVVARGARNSRKRFGGRLEKFICLEVHATRRQASTLARLDEIRITESFPRLSEDLDRMAMAEAWLELSGRMIIPGEEGGEVFDWLLASWRQIQMGAWQSGDFYLAILVFLRTQGVLAPLECCARCQSDSDSLIFSAVEGGVICMECVHEGLRLSHAVLPCLRRTAHWCTPEDLAGQAPPMAVRDLRAMVRDAVHVHVGGELRSLRVWEDFLVEH